MGSFSNTCAQLGGDCLCKPNVAGQKCNKCRQTTWGFSSKGCQRNYIPLLNFIKYKSLSSKY